MSRHLRFSTASLDDLEGIREYTEASFGEEQADRYDALLEQALLDVKDDPYRLQSRARPELGAGFRSYRVELSAGRSGTGIKGARHVVVYVDLSEDAVGVSRILHDSMIVERHIPAAHLQGEQAFLIDEVE